MTNCVHIYASHAARLHVKKYDLDILSILGKSHRDDWIVLGRVKSDLLIPLKLDKSGTSSEENADKAE